MECITVHAPACVPDTQGMCDSACSVTSCHKIATSKEHFVIST